MGRHVQPRRDVYEGLAEPAADRFGHLAVYGPETAEEGVRSFERLVDELVDEHQMPRRDLVPQRPDGPAGNHGVNAELLEREDVRGVRHLAGRQLVSLAVAVEKGDPPGAQAAEQNRPAGLAERRLDLPKLHRRQLSGQRITQPRAADDANQFPCHILGLPGEFLICRMGFSPCGSSTKCEGQHGLKPILRN